MQPGPTVPPYDFSIGSVLQEAWSLTSGMKRLSFVSLLLVSLVLILISNLLVVFGLTLDPNAPLSDPSVFVGSAFVAALTAPFAIGVTMLGIYRALGLPLRFDMLFLGLKRPLPLALTAFMLSVLTQAGLLLFLLPGLYLTVAYTMALPLTLEKGLGAWDALELSRRTVTRRWFKVAALFLLLGLLIVISAIPFGIGLFWTMPLVLNANGILYREMFGLSVAKEVRVIEEAEGDLY